MGNKEGECNVGIGTLKSVADVEDELNYRLI